MNVYDELPYRSRPIPCTAPERLAVVSWLHDGPVPRLGRVLELGCGDGANLLPMAFYRPGIQFVGVDGSAGAIAAAQGLANLRFVHADLRHVDLGDEVDVIIAHGVFSWVPDAVRDALLSLVARHLAGDGLFYCSYNARPGWDVRGLVRDWLRGQVGEGGLASRAARAKELAAQMAAAFAASEHAYAQLMAGELRFVAEGELSYVAHEFLADDNRAYWRSEFDALVARHGLAVVADADFARDSGRVAPGLPDRLRTAGVKHLDDTVDLLSYRQLCSPVLARAGWKQERRDLGRLWLVSSLSRQNDRVFRDPRGTEVTVSDARLAAGLEAAPGRVGELFAPVAEVEDDLRLLHGQGLIELRLGPTVGRDASELHRLEAGRGYRTTAMHEVE